MAQNRVVANRGGSKGATWIGGASRGNAGSSPNPVTRSRATSAGMGRSGSIGNLAKKNGFDSSFSAIESQYIKNLQQQIYYLELENAYLKNQLKKGRGYQPELIGETDRYLDKLKKLHEQKERMDGQLKEKEQECHTLMKERHHLHERLQRIEDEYSRDKRSLSEEIVELRKQLDDIGPELTRRHSQVTQLNADLQEASKRLRMSQRTVELMEAQLNQKTKEEETLSQMEGERKSEMDRLLDSIKEVECELGEERHKARALNEEMGSIRGQLRELELEAKKDRAVAEKVTEENSSLIKENAQLAAKVAQAHAMLEQYESQIRHDHVLSENAHLRENERQLRLQLSKFQEMHKLEETRTKKLTSQLTEQEMGQHAVKEAQTKLQTQLQSLEEIVLNIGNENKQLRSEKIKIESRLEEMRNLMSTKDMQLQTLHDRVRYLEQHQKDLLRQLEEETQVQEAKFRELERTATQCREISRSIRHASVLGKSATPDTPLSNGVP